jgi:hypothetical protein
MKKLTIISGLRASGKTTYVNNLKNNLPKGVEYLDLEQKPYIKPSVTVCDVNPIKTKDFVVGVIDEIPMLVPEMVDLLFMNSYYMWKGINYASHYIITTNIPKSEFPLSFVNHPEVEFIELPPVLDRKILEQKVKDFLYEQAHPEVLRAVEHTVENPIPKVDHPTYNIYDWKIEMTLIPGMVAPKPSAPTSDSIHWLNTTDVRDNYVPGNPAPKK